MSNPAALFEVGFCGAARRLRGEADDRTTEEENSLGNKAIAASPEAVIKLRTAVLFDLLAADMAEIAKEMK